MRCFCVGTSIAYSPLDTEYHCLNDRLLVEYMNNICFI